MRRDKPTKPEPSRRKPWMGPLPASAGCDCQICRPEDHYDPSDRQSIDTVLEHGWQVLFVGDHLACSDPNHDHSHDHQHEDHGSQSPSFAYTVGLGHRCGHSELLMSGLDTALLGRALNYLAARIMAGQRLAAGDVVEGVLAGVPVVLERVADEALRETVTWSGWFHRRKPEALMVVWPSTAGLFAWQPGAPAILDELQPRRWRQPITHTGAVGADPEWLFPIPPDRFVLSCRHVVQDREPILWVARESDDDHGERWSVHCGAYGHDTDDLCLVHIAHLIRAAPSVRELSSLPMDHEAERPHVDAGWVATPLA